MPVLLAQRPLTVVIAAYNVAPYIAECVNSVLNQPECEQSVDVIVVVDGATDETETVLRHAIAGREHLVHIVVQKNAGLSAARNSGLALVKTPFVTFLDGDDRWEPEYLSLIAPHLSSGDNELIEYDARLIDEHSVPCGTLKIAIAAAGEVHPVDRDQFLGRFLCYAWARVFRTELVRRHLFPSGMRFEDTATIPWYYWYSQAQLSIGRPLVGYRQRAQSILATPISRDVEDLTATAQQAAAMYAQTGSSYWQEVAYRAFQQACRRATWLPVRTWPRLLRRARSALDNVPTPPGLSRWLLAHATLGYTALLYAKRRMIG